MNCADARERILEYLDLELDTSARGAVDLHLEACDACRDLAARHRRSWGLLEELPAGATPTPQRLDELTDAVLRRARAEEPPAPRAGRSLSLRRLLPLAAAAAILAVALLLVRENERAGAPEQDAPVAGADADLDELLSDPALMVDFEVIQDLAELEQPGLGELLDLDEEQAFFLVFYDEV